ncbi:MAG TPA: phosphatase PAP2 family protein [Terriglobia bacterium]|nr:phosphatase PAP2 family protein [Terriglobia bacterium]
MADAKAVGIRLRFSEKLTLIFLTYLSAAATFFRISVTQGLSIATLNLATGGVIALLARFSADRNVPRQTASGDQRTRMSQPRLLGMTLTPRDGKSELLAVIRDWFPAIVILLAYRESGLFGFPDPSHRLDRLFVGWDHVLFQNAWVIAALDFGAPWLQRYLEFCYSLCYPLVPLGLGALYILLARSRRDPGREFDAERALDHFWTATLLALFTCYALFPLFPSTPPRILFHDLPAPVVSPLFRRVNFWILGQYGIQSSVFPSGHVAAVTAVALAVRAHWRRAGTVFAIAAVSIAVATVVGRYHYAADAVAGALIGTAAFFIATRIHKP